MALLNLSVIAFFTPAVLTVLALPSAAQGQKGLVLPLQEATQIAQSGDNSRQLQQFTSTFRNGLTRGCLNNPPKGLVNPRKYCSCYANSFVNRYQSEDLVTIERRANTPESASLIGLMMSPEIRACKSQN